MPKVFHLWHRNQEKRLFLCQITFSIGIESKENGSIYANSFEEDFDYLLQFFPCEFVFVIIKGDDEVFS